VILIHPPIVKPSEPPAGLAALSGALDANGVRHTLVDANLEAMLWLLQGASSEPGTNYERSEMSGEARRALPVEGVLNPNNCTWTRRALLHLPANLALLRDWQGYTNSARYRKAVSEVNRIIEGSAPRGAHLSLADYGHNRLIPVKSGDLLYAAGHPEENVFYPYFTARLSALLEDGEGHSVIGISLNYLSQALCAFSIIGFLRPRYPHVRIVLGGGLITSWMSNAAWNNPFEGLVDQLVSGPGELPLLSLLGVKTELHSKVHRGGDEEPTQAYSAVRQGEQRGANKDGAKKATWYEARTGEACPSFDSLPLNLYLAPGPILPYAGSRGCYWGRCSFCPEKAQRQTCSPKPGSRVIADLRGLAARHRPALIHLVDDAVSPALMAAIAASPMDTPWYGFARITADLADPEFCRRLRASGCVMLKLGLESGDQGLLDALGKGIDLGTAAQALEALTRAGIGTYVYLLFGTPKEDLASARKTLAFVAGHSAFISFLNLAIFNLPVNCEETHGLDLRAFYDGDLSLYTDFVHPHGWGRREVRAFLAGEFKGHPAIRPILLRQPPLFTSNHAPLLHMAQWRRERGE
jgi:radical SAM superfamily enzyme YgiQ (UPF0313 family)